MQRKHYSMRWKIIGILLICWLIPFTFLIGVMGVYVATNHSDMTAMNYRSQFKFNNRICVERLNRAVADSRQASYDGDILNIRKQFLHGEISYDRAKKECTDYLNAKYQLSNTVSSAILWFEDDGPFQSNGVYSSKGKGSFQQTRDFWEKDYDTISEFAKTLDTSVGFMERDKTLYLVRNMKDNRYQTQGVLVFCLNQEYCFDSLSGYPMENGVCIWVDGNELVLKKNDKVDDWAALYEETKERGYKWHKNQLCVTDGLSGDTYRLCAAMLLDKSVTMFPFYGYQYVIAGMLLALIPLLAAVIHVFRREVTYPVQALSDGAQHIAQGEFGYQIEPKTDNLEFTYLTEAFNQMSARLKEQFDRIYQEEIALREARIMALQSHINPHFMNNTMEIINWEARLEGNSKVSKMIEALSTMMDAAMDRRKRPEVTLREEMGYVNSYLYIMKERLGKRLTVELDIPEELMNCPVPRLILQPVIENAIEHGVVPNGSGTVSIRGYHDRRYLYLDTQNDGGLTQEDRERIHRLLDPDYNTSKEPSGNLGIANVNQRLHILFGPPCGFTIREEEAGKVTARLTIPFRAPEEEGL